MKEFDLKVDEKVTVWVRRSYTVKARDIHSAINSIIEGEQDNYDGQTLYETEEYMTPTENGGQSTYDIIDDDGNLVWDNVNKFEI